ncbi:hypothetical protein [Spirosoma rhododendri]|uniref:Uncharacterized protein n=1 Tax=Spirosoma rhododendri TaxID=2728024 RepID=A0A7L5DQN4_9BACT|nr:hypothetical protein [Spirosoma rhododendri]QJD79543.1 hypothetical protein HH216_14825 [Spirosoma rhododendri]
MTYFIRISSQNRPANRLQQAILDHFGAYHSVLTSDPTSIYQRLSGAVEQAHRSYRRCTKQTVSKQHDYSTKEIVAIYVDGLIQLSMHPVLRTVYLDPTPPKPEPTAPPLAAPNQTDDPPGEVLPRAVIYKQRDSSEELRLDYWYKFSTQVQSLLRQGVIWRIYLNENASPIAELYGGRTIPAYL